jgi:hypothetical protein
MAWLKSFKNLRAFYRKQKQNGRHVAARLQASQRLLDNQILGTDATLFGQCRRLG